MKDMNINNQFGYNKQSARKNAASYLFNFLIATNFLQYLEAGAVPALLLRLATAFDMSSGQQGLLGGIVYLSLSFGGPVAGYLLRHYDHKTVVGLALAINNIFTLMWALTPVDYEYSALLFIVIRFFMGLTQCVVCVFLPLWTNEYAPRNKRTTWMGRLQASVPFGVMTGYIIASLSISLSRGKETCGSILCWRIPILIEVILVTPFCIGIFFVPKEHIKIRIVHSNRRSYRVPTVTATDNFSTPNKDQGNSSSRINNMSNGVVPLFKMHGKPTVTSSNGNNDSNVSNDNAINDNNDNHNNDVPHATINATESDYELSYDVEDNSRGWYLDDEEKKRLSRLRQQSISASVFLAGSSRDVVRKSFDNLCTLDSSDDLITMLPGIKWGKGDEELRVDSEEDDKNGASTITNTITNNIDRDMSYKSKYYSNGSTKSSSRNKRRDDSNSGKSQVEKRASWFDTFFNKKSNSSSKSTIKIELPTLNILNNKNEPIFTSSSTQASYGTLDSEKDVPCAVNSDSNRTKNTHKIRNSRKSNSLQYQSLRDALIDNPSSVSNKPTVSNNKQGRSRNSSSSTGSDTPWLPPLSPEQTLASSLVIPMSPTNIDIDISEARATRNMNNGFMRRFLNGHRSRAISVDSDDSTHAFHSLDIEKKKQAMQELDQDINEELLVSFSSTAYSSNSSEGSDEEFEGFTPKSKQGYRNSSSNSNMFSSIKALLGIPVYRYLLGAMAALYFTVTGVQYWGTSYMHVALNAPLPLVNALFIACAATGPTLGVFFGGWAVDYLGGYQGARQRVIALELCCACALVGCLFSLPITYIKDIFIVVPLLWVVLFCGGAILPACSGIIVSIVPRRHRPVSSSLSLVVFNLFGYCLSLLLSGYLMQTLNSYRSNFCDSVCSWTWGFRLILMWSNFSLVFLVCALFASYRALSKKLNDRILEEEDQDQ